MKDERLAKKILLWISPFTELQWPLQKRAWVKVFVPRLLDALGPAVGPVMPTLVLSEDLYGELRSEGYAFPGETVTFAQRDLLDGYQVNALSLMKRAQRGEYASSDWAHVIRLVKERLGAVYVPDIVFVFGIAPFMRELFPSAEVFHHEYSLFSRAPYPETLTFDPTGNGYRFLLSRRAGEINAVPASKTEISAIGEFRETMRGVLTSNAFVGKYFSELRERFSHVVLLALGYENFYETLVRLPHQGLFEVVEHVLDSVDGDTCVVVTQHPTLAAVPAVRLDELRRRHPQLQSEAWFAGVPCFSQVALAYVDACVFTNTSVAYQAAFLGLRMVSLEGFCGGICEGVGFESLQNLFVRPKANKDNFVVWALTRYSIGVPDMARQLALYRKAGVGHSDDCDRVLSVLPRVLDAGELGCRLRDWGRRAEQFARDLAALGEPCSPSAQATRRIELLEAECLRLQGICDDLVKTRSELSAHVEDLGAERESLFRNLERIDADRAAVRQALVQAREQNSKLEQTARGRDRQLMKCKEELSTAQANVDRSVAEIGALRKTIAEAQGLNAKQAQEIGVLRKDLESMSESLERQFRLTAIYNETISEMVRERMSIFSKGGKA